MSPEILPQLFNSYVELHTTQLGLLVGLFVGLLYRDHPLAAYALLFTSVLFAFGNGTHIGYAAIDRKPWYFLSALYVSSVGNLLLLKYGGPLWQRLPTLPNSGSNVGADGTGEDVLGTDDGL